MSDPSQTRARLKRLALRGDPDAFAALGTLADRRNDVGLRRWILARLLSQGLPLTFEQRGAAPCGLDGLLGSLRDAPLWLDQPARLRLRWSPGLARKIAVDIVEQASQNLRLSDPLSSLRLRAIDMARFFADGIADAGELREVHDAAQDAARAITAKHVRSRATRDSLAFHLMRLCVTITAAPARDISSLTRWTASEARARLCAPRDRPAMLSRQIEVLRGHLAVSNA